VVAVPALVAREARLLAALHPAEERLIGPVQPRQHVLQHVAVDGGVLREFRPNGLQLGFLLVAGDGDAAALPGGDALLQGRVVERAAAPEHVLQRPLLGRRGARLLLIGFADALPFHLPLFCLTGTQAAIHRTSG
jgi:hypothetical protein